MKVTHFFFFFQAEDGILDYKVTGVQTCALPILSTASRIYGATNPIFGGTIPGLLNGDTIPANYSTTATTNSAPGNYSIAPTLNDSGNKIGRASCRERV